MINVGNGQLNQISMSQVCNTLDCMHDQQIVMGGGEYGAAQIDPA